MPSVLGDGCHAIHAADRRGMPPMSGLARLSLFSLGNTRGASGADLRRGDAPLVWAGLSPPLVPHWPGSALPLMWHLLIWHATTSCPRHHFFAFLLCVCVHCPCPLPLAHRARGRPSLAALAGAPAATTHLSSRPGSRRTTRGRCGQTRTMEQRSVDVVVGCGGGGEGIHRWRGQGAAVKRDGVPMYVMFMVVLQCTCSGGRGSRRAAATEV